MEGKPVCKSLKTIVGISKLNSFVFIQIFISIACFSSLTLLLQALFCSINILLQVPSVGVQLKVLLLPSLCHAAQLSGEDPSTINWVMRSLFLFFPDIELTFFNLFIYSLRACINPSPFQSSKQISYGTSWSLKMRIQWRDVRAFEPCTCCLVKE